MRIVTYNILDGGVGRADPLAEVIEAQRADVVVLVEADDTEVLDRLVKRLKVDHIHAPGRGHAIAVLSRWTIVASTNHALIDPAAPRSLLETVIRTPGGADLPILSLHLHARATEEDENIRQREIASVLRIAHPWRVAATPHILVGDFNANSPIQQIDPARCKRATREAMESNAGQLPRRVVENLLDHGYVDTLHAARPNEAPTLASFTTHEPGQRVDYVFTYGIDASRIRRAWIEQDRLAQFASDHFPAGAEIDV